MGLITLTCKQCGGQIEIDNSKEFCFCMHCGTKAVIQQDIIQNIQNITHNTTQNITKNIYGVNGKGFEDYIKNGDSFLSLPDYARAKEQYEFAVKENPNDCRGWFGLVKCSTRNLRILSDTEHEINLERALKVASPEQSQQIQQEYSQFGTLRSEFRKYKRWTSLGNTVSDNALKEVSQKIEKHFIKCPFCGGSMCLYVKPPYTSNKLSLIDSYCFGELLCDMGMFIGIKRIVVGNSLGINNLKNLKKGQVLL